MQQSPTGKTIWDLPDEILIAIFSYLTCHDIKYNVSKVCVQWSALSRDTKLWRHLHFETTNRSKKVFGLGSWYATLKFLETTPQLQNLVVSQGHSDGEIIQILKCLNTYSHQLCHIEFDVDLVPVVKHLKGMDNLLNLVESLKLNLTPTVRSQGHLFKTLLAFKNLRKIAFSGSNPEVSSFTTFLRDCRRLEHLNVLGVSEFSKSNFFSLVKYKDKFRGLALKIDALDETCLKLLPIFPNLKDLNLADGNSSGKKLDCVARLGPLSRLHIQEDASSPVLTSSALTQFFQTGIFTHLLHLKLHKSRLNDEGAAEIRRNCPNLMYLEVMTYPRCLSSLTETALLHFLHCQRLQHFEILFPKSEEIDWIYRRIRHVNHDCDVDASCPVGLEGLLSLWDEIQIPVD